MGCVVSQRLSTTLCKQNNSDEVVKPPDNMVAPYSSCPKGSKHRKPAQSKPPPMEWFPTRFCAIHISGECSCPTPAQQGGVVWGKTRLLSTRTVVEQSTQNRLLGQKNVNRDAAATTFGGACGHCHQSYCPQLWDMTTNHYIKTA